MLVMGNNISREGFKTIVYDPNVASSSMLPKFGDKFEVFHYFTKWTTNSISEIFKTKHDFVTENGIVLVHCALSVEEHEQLLKYEQYNVFYAPVHDNLVLLDDRHKDLRLHHACGQIGTLQLVDNVVGQKLKMSLVSVFNAYYLGASAKDHPHFGDLAKSQDPMAKMMVSVVLGDVK